MSLNAADEGRRRGKDRADFERAYAEAYRGVNAGDTPGSGIRGSGGLGLGSGQKRSIDEYEGGGSGGVPDLAGRSTLEFREPRSQIGREPSFGQARTRPVGRGAQESGNSRPDVDAGLAEREKRAADKEAAAETLLRQRFPGGVTDTIAKARETQQAAAAPKQVDPMASLKAPLQVAPGTFDPKATGENPFPAAQTAIPSAAAPAAASITAIPAAQAPAQAVKPYELTYQKADGSFYGETREGKGQTFTTMEEAQQFSRGQAQAPAQVAATPAPVQPASTPAATPAPQVAAAKVAAAAPSPVDNSTAGMAPVASIKGLGQRAGQGLDFLASNPTAANPAMAADTIVRQGGALVNGLWDGNYTVPEKGIFRRAGEELADAIYSPPTSLPALPKPAAPGKPEIFPGFRGQVPGALPGIAPQVMAFDAPGNPVSAANVPNNVVQSPVSVAPAAPQVMAFNAPGNPVSASPAPVINAGPYPVQPMAPQSVANMDVPTLFKHPGGVRGQSRTSVIKPTPFYQL